MSSQYFLALSAGPGKAARTSYGLRLEPREWRASTCLFRVCLTFVCFVCTNTRPMRHRLSVRMPPSPTYGELVIGRNKRWRTLRSASHTPSRHKATRIPADPEPAGNQAD
ncbi:hypothetical protein LZ31DRAFT_107023 [Colletotrichum somersetense]|nr:hypothetical protein LZ31DRAFT_107023 [Colletotrichum somersetense]